MARAIWSGVLTFGLVSLPVEPARVSQEGTVQEARREEVAGWEEGGHPQASRLAAAAYCHPARDCEQCG